jgi:hypothetical protein
MSFLSFLFLLAVCFSACDKDTCDCDNGNENTEPIVNEYYVKYVIYTTGYAVFSDWSVTTPQGNYSRNGYQTRRWEQIYGPVKKGFICGVQVGNGAPTIEIHVSKNSEPFALKRTTTGQSASYTIDF